MFFKPTNSQFLTESLNFFRVIEGERISKISRLVEGGISRYIKDFNLAESDVFELCSGPIFLTFDCGLCLGFGDSPKDQSIVVWEQKDIVTSDQYIKSEALEEDDIVIDSENPRYINKKLLTFIGAEISDVTIMKIKNSDLAQRRFRNERGLTLSTVDGRDLFFSLQMSKDAPGHLILTTKIDIRTELLNNLESLKG